MLLVHTHTHTPPLRSPVPLPQLPPLLMAPSPYHALPDLSRRGGLTLGVQGGGGGELLPPYLYFATYSSTNNFVNI